MVGAYYDGVSKEIVPQSSCCIDEGQSYLLDLLILELGTLLDLARKVYRFMPLECFSDKGSVDGLSSDDEVEIKGLPIIWPGED